MSSKDSLLTELKEIRQCKFNYDSLHAAFELNQPYENYLSRDKFSWFYSELSDTARFARTDDLKPMCLLFENRHISSIAFTDIYDYKQAIHIVNFRKPDYAPMSSFIVYSIGGDAEDFWYREVESIGRVEFRLTDKDGYYNSIEKVDTIFYNRRTITEIKIDTVSGLLTKTVIDDKADFYELIK